MDQCKLGAVTGYATLVIFYEWAPVRTACRSIALPIVSTSRSRVPTKFVSGQPS